MVRDGKGKLALRAFASQAEDTLPELLQAPGGGIAATAVEGLFTAAKPPIKLVHIYTICYRAKNDDGGRSPWTNWESCSNSGRTQRKQCPASCFDMPGRPMNVFSNAAIAELATFSRWLRESDVKGVSHPFRKAIGILCRCRSRRTGVGLRHDHGGTGRGRAIAWRFDHFFSLSQALRGIETAGKPVAASIAGLALGGGGELALATHHRVMVDDPKVRLACRNLSSGCCREAEEPSGCRA